MTADVEVDAHLKGVDPGNGGVLAYQAVPILARTIYSNYDGRQPFYTNYGKGPQPNSAATYDAVTGSALQTAGRHIDPYGNATELHKISLLLHYWMLDGCPTNMGAIGSATNRIPLYIRLANQLRPWPAGFQGAATGEPTQVYPAFPPSASTPLDTFSAQASTRDVAKARAEFLGVKPVVRQHKPKGLAEHVHAVLEHVNVPQFSSQPTAFAPGGHIGPEHYAAAGLSGQYQAPIGYPATSPGTGQIMHGVEGKVGEWTELSSQSTAFDRVLEKLESIERRLDRAGL